MHWWGWQGKWADSLVRRRCLLNEERSVCSGKANESIKKRNIKSPWLHCGVRSVYYKRGRIMWLCNDLLRSNLKHLRLHLNISESHKQRAAGLREILPVLVCHLPATGKKNLNFADSTKCLHEANALCQILYKQAHQNKQIHLYFLHKNSFFSPFFSSSSEDFKCCCGWKAADGVLSVKSSLFLSVFSSFYYPHFSNEESLRSELMAGWSKDENEGRGCYMTKKTKPNKTKTDKECQALQTGMRQFVCQSPSNKSSPSLTPRFPISRCDL